MSVNLLTLEGAKFLYHDGIFDVWEHGFALYAIRCQCVARQDPHAAALAAAKRELGAGFTFENFDPTLNLEAFAKCQNLSRQWKQGGYLSGPIRTGKTHLAKAIYYAAVAQGKRAGFITAHDLGKAFLGTAWLGEEGERDRVRLRDLTRCSVVVVDDLGAQHSKEPRRFIADFQAFLDQYRGVLVVTTNLDADDLSKVIGEPSIARLTERCEEIEFQHKGA